MPFPGVPQQVHLTCRVLHQLVVCYSGISCSSRPLLRVIKLCLSREAIVVYLRQASLVDAPSFFPTLYFLVFMCASLLCYTLFFSKFLLLAFFSQFFHLYFSFIHLTYYLSVYFPQLSVSICPPYTSSVE